MSTLVFELDLDQRLTLDVQKFVRIYSDLNPLSLLVISFQFLPLYIMTNIQFEIIDGKAAELATNESTKLRMLESQKLIKVLQTQGDPVSVRFGRNKPSVVLARRNRCTLLEEVW